jgi:hypothetical protein
MKFLTFIVAMSGAKGHGFARKMFENNSDYRWYDHPKNNLEADDKFKKLDFSGHHFQKEFSNGTRFPHMFDRIENYLTNIDSYYNLIKDEIHECSQDKKICYVCHEPPKRIRERYPDSQIIQILPSADRLEFYFNRHLQTSMLFPLQVGIHKRPGRKELLNDLYWDHYNYSLKDDDHCLMNFYKQKMDIKQVIEMEWEKQKSLYKKNRKEMSYADKTIIFYDENSLFKGLTT